MVPEAQNEGMFTINCNNCNRTSLVNTQNIVSTHRSLEGTVAYVNCYCGHLAVHVFPRPERVIASWMIDQEELQHAPAC